MTSGALRGRKGGLRCIPKNYPCLDVKEGHVESKALHLTIVELRDAGVPVELAALYDTEAADELFILDIMRLVEQRKSMLDVHKPYGGTGFSCR